jgi:hypothetical protein
MAMTQMRRTTIADIWVELVSTLFVVVKEKMYDSFIAFPARSFVDVDIVIVYFVFDCNFVEGVHV